MSKLESEAAYQRAGNLQQGDRWSKRYRVGQRTARTYQNESGSYRVLELKHGGLNIELKMHRVPPDDANLEFANIIMDAVEKIIREGEKE